MAMFDAVAFALAFFLASKASDQHEKTDIGYHSETGEGSSNRIAQLISHLHDYNGVQVARETECYDGTYD